MKRIARNPTVNAPHFELKNHGSLFLLRPLNSVAQGWMQEHLPVDAPETRFWGDAIVIDSRFIAPLEDGIVRDGLVLR